MKGYCLALYAAMFSNVVFSGDMYNDPNFSGHQNLKI